MKHEASLPRAEEWGVAPVRGRGLKHRGECVTKWDKWVASPPCGGVD